MQTKQLYFPEKTHHVFWLSSLALAVVLFLFVTNANYQRKFDNYLPLSDSTTHSSAKDGRYIEKHITPSGVLKKALIHKMTAKSRKFKKVVLTVVDSANLPPLEPDMVNVTNG